jgi:tetratricopeptide (TPR) repeat protein
MSHERITMDRKQGLHQKVVLIIFWICLVLACFNVKATSHWLPYLQDHKPLILPITSAEAEMPKWELFVGEQDQIFALDFKNGQLVVFDSQGREIKHRINLPFPSDVLANNGSMWVSKDRIYLKPAIDDSVWVFNLKGLLMQKIKLESPMDNFYDFWDIVVDPRGYIYLLDGRTYEIKVFNPEGGYEGVFLKKGERPNDLHGAPDSFCIDNEGSFYFAARVSGSLQSRIHKYSYQGRFLTTFVESPATHYYRTIWVDSYQNLYALAPDESLVVKFDPRGQKICQFQTGCLAGLASSRNGTVLVASSKRNEINRFLPSQVIELIDEGNRAFSDKKFDHAESCFKQALVLNNQLDYLHSIMGEVYYHQRRFRKAMIEFGYLRDYWRYSQSLVEFRNELIINYGIYYGAVLAVIIGLGCLTAHYLRRYNSSKGSSLIKVPQLRKGLLFGATQTLTPIGAISLILFLIVSYYLSWYYTNPIFIAERQVFSVLIFGRHLTIFITLTLVWSVVAYKVGELFQGMASYRAILSGTAVSLIPLIWGFPLLALISRLLTYDLLWIYQWLNYLLILWVAALFVKTLKETEVFSWSKALGVGLVNLAASGLALLFIGFLLGVNQQLASFLTELIYEVWTRLAG